MRVVYILVALVIVLGWCGSELRGRYPDVASVLFGFAALLVLFAVGAIFGMY